MNPSGLIWVFLQFCLSLLHISDEEMFLYNNKSRRFKIAFSAHHNLLSSCYYHTVDKAKKDIEE